ncbi:MAG: hypothetical protein WBZ36_14700 [Candidatus Nitrosopolaris sp.]
MTGYLDMNNNCNNGYAFTILYFQQMLPYVFETRMIAKRIKKYIIILQVTDCILVERSILSVCFIFGILVLMPIYKQQHDAKVILLVNKNKIIEFIQLKDPINISKEKKIY